MLSWSNQLQLDKDLRRLQGHHREDSAQFYSRHDVGGALKLQSQVVDAVKAQWRPHTPLARGGQVPLIEPAFVLEQFRRQKSDFTWDCFQFGVQRQIFVPPNDRPEDSEASSSSSESSSSSSASTAKHPTAPAQSSRAAPVVYDEAEMGLYPSTWHVTLAFDPRTKSPLDPSIVLTACGRRFASQHFQPKSHLDLSPMQSLCTHPGCRKGWAAIGALDS